MKKLAHPLAGFKRDPFSGAFIRTAPRGPNTVKHERLLTEHVTLINALQERVSALEIQVRKLTKGESK